MVRGNVQKKKQYIYRHYPNWGWPPSLPPYFWQIIFWQCVHHVDLPPSQWIFDKNHPLLGFKITSCTLHSYIYILYCKHYTKGSKKRCIILKFQTFRHNFRLYRYKFWEKNHSKMCFGPLPLLLLSKNYFAKNFWIWVDLPPSYLDNVCKYTGFFFGRHPLDNLSYSFLGIYFEISCPIYT